ncbi:malonate--CoA ligase [Salix suchowensis]|nr:malonate--CoA ligase [Salix suchowensis]
MKQARDVRDQLEGLLERVENELSSNPNDLDVTELKPDWLVEIAPHYYQMKDVEDRMLSFSLYVSVYLCVCVHVLLKGLNIIAVQAGWQ